MQIEKDRVEVLITKQLEETINNCAFKQAWIPAGWACVNIEAFAKKMASVIGTTKKEM